MDYLLSRLIKETIKFLEICQEYSLKNAISVDQYRNLTNIKFKFINDVLNIEKKNIVIDIELRKRLNKLFINDCRITHPSKFIVG